MRKIVGKILVRLHLRKALNAQHALDTAVEQTKVVSIEHDDVAFLPGGVRGGACITP